MDILKLNSMRFHAYHGCLPQEYQVGNDYEVDLALSVDLKKACLSDRLEDTINYALAYEVVNEYMQKPVQLIEHLAEEITAALRRRYPQIQEINIHLRKLNPPIAGQIESAEVILTR